MFMPKLFAKGDRGGNLIKTDKGRNLHSLWDRLLPFETTLGGIGSQAKRLLDEAGEHGAVAAQSLLPEKWLAESLDYAGEFVYDRSIRAAIQATEETGEGTVSVKISDDYFKVAGHLARRRAVEAGFRLAIVVDF